MTAVISACIFFKKYQKYHFNTEDGREKRQHFWHIMLYYFRKGKNTTEIQKKNCAVYGEGVMTD